MTLTDVQQRDAEQTAQRMIDRYASSRNDSAVDAALDYRHSYDRGTYGWEFWNTVLQFICRSIPERRPQ